jgi:hypothetical protein
VRPAELGEEIALELEALEATVKELLALERDVAHTEPTVREKTAAAAFLAQFYNGTENILKRISHHHNVPLPTGEAWHVDLFQRFCAPSFPGLPLLFDKSLASALAPYRRFRHVVFHSYGFQLDWDRMAEGVANVEDTFSQLKAALSIYLATIGVQSSHSGTQS